LILALPPGGKGPRTPKQLAVEYLRARVAVLQLRFVVWCEVKTLAGLGSLSRLPWHLLENALHNACPNTELLASLEDAATRGSQLQYSRFYRGLDAASAQFRTVCSGTGEPSIDSFPNDSPLKLSEYPKHLKHRLPRGGRSIEPLLVKE
jgi:hypothetical protein